MKRFAKPAEITPFFQYWRNIDKEIGDRIAEGMAFERFRQRAAA